MKFHIKTFGCKVNQSESEELAGELSKRGLVETKHYAQAELVIINTCTVTSTADSKARQFVSRAINSAKGRVIVTGCAVNNPGSGLNKFKDNVQFIKREEKPELAKHFCEPRGPVAAVSRPVLSPEWPACAPVGSPPSRHPSLRRSRPFLKIQDGCSHSCSYCIVPVVRGPSVSLPTDAIKKQAKVLLEEGYKEIVITGVDIGAYNYKKRPLEQLIEDLLNLQDDFRIRLSSIEPQSLSDRFISLVNREDRICEHFHLPLQSGSDRILKLMNRPYTADHFRDVVSKFRRARPAAAITTDIIVGFPSETEDDFLQTEAILKEIGFSRIHIFRYSSRPGVSAASLPKQITADLKKERAGQLKQLSEKLSEKYKKAQLGKTAEVLVERNKDGYYEGTSSNYLPVYFLNNNKSGSLKGQLARVRIGEFKGGRLFGKLVK